MLHLILLHAAGSNNPLGVKLHDDIPFYPYFFYKDLFGFWLFAMLFIYLVFFEPNLLGHPDNYIRANPLSTPTHIVPEWYFLPWYAILRAIPDKLGGVVMMGAGIAILAVLPSLEKNGLVRSPIFRPVFQVMYWFLILAFFGLGWLGGEPIEDPYTVLSRIAGVYYFAYFLIIIPGLVCFESWALSVEEDFKKDQE